MNRTKDLIEEICDYARQYSARNWLLKTLTATGVRPLDQDTWIVPASLYYFYNCSIII